MKSVNVKAGQCEPVIPPVIIELDGQIALTLAALLVDAVPFCDEPWAKDIYDGVRDATGKHPRGYAKFQYDESSGFMERA